MRLSRYIVFIMLLWSFCSFSLPADSIGIEKKGGKTYIKHKVESGETLYRLSKRYGASVDAIKEENPSLDKGLSQGLVLSIPYSKSKSNKVEKLSDSKNTTKIEAPKEEKAVVYKTHTVESGQGLYSIAKMYQVSVDQIKEWNALKTNAVKTGQVLKIIVTTSKPIANDLDKDLPVTKPKDVTDVLETTKKVNTTRPISDKVSPQTQKFLDTLKVKSYRKQDGPTLKSFHLGTAKITYESELSEKFEAYYNQAEIGQFINVRNLVNDEKVFLKVIGKLPANVDSQTIIVITPKALERLQSTDAKLAVEVSYIAP
jgi:LysM repeat protein